MEIVVPKLWVLLSFVDQGHADLITELGSHSSWRSACGRERSPSSPRMTLSPTSSIPPSTRPKSGAASRPVSVVMPQHPTPRHHPHPLSASSYPPKIPKLLHIHLSLPHRHSLLPLPHDEGNVRCPSLQSPHLGITYISSEAHVIAEHDLIEFRIQPALDFGTEGLVDE
jgi:hypothetical protein